MPVQWLKVAILPLDLPCSGLVTHSGEIPTTAKSHQKKPDRQFPMTYKNDIIIEQVTDFTCLGYRISEYKSDLEDKLQTYNKINGAIRRHFGKQMNKETKLKIHNNTAKAALKFGSEAWVLKKREKQRLEAAQMKFLRHLFGITKLDKEKKTNVLKKKQEQRIQKRK